MFTTYSREVIKVKGWTVREIINKVLAECEGLTRRDISVVDHTRPYTTWSVNFRGWAQADDILLDTIAESYELVYNNVYGYYDSCTIRA